LGEVTGTSAQPSIIGDAKLVDMTCEGEDAEGTWLPLWLSSTLKKRKAKMNKHKLRKRRKKERLKVRRQ